MSSLKQIRFTLIFALALALPGTLTAQDSADLTAQRSSVTITAAASADRVRITAPASVVQMHLEVYSVSGEKLFDNEIRGGNVFDWNLQDGQAQRLSSGDYVCVVTVKNIAGRITQKIGSVKVAEKDVRVGPAELAQLSPQQSQVIGPVEENSSWTILDNTENQTTTVIAHDGTDGQIVRGRGAFSFRIGDFFSGNDKEQMRLTEEGNLGIGISKPQFKLDVAGAIRARGGFVFNDGSTLKVNDKGLLTLTDSNGSVVPDVSGSGTTGRLTKWTDGASGTLGDSVAIDTGTGLQLTAAPSGAVDTNLLYLNSTNGTTGVLAGSVPSFGAANGPFFAMRGNAYTTIGNQRGLFTIAAGNVSSPVGDDGSVKFNTGNDQLRMVIRPNGRVGIGTDTPAKRLDVAGDINVSGDYNIGGDRVFSIDFANGNTFAGIVAGAQNTGFHNSFFGDLAGVVNTSGRDNTFFGYSAGSSNVLQPGNSYFGSIAGRDSTGNANSFFGASAGVTSTTGGSNTFIGVQTGETNRSGFANTLLGINSDVGANNLDHATAIGAEAVVSSSNTIALGRSDGSDTVIVPGKLEVDTMGVSGVVQLCLNGSSRLSFCSSSLRYKTAVQPFPGGLKIIQRLRPIAFTWKDGRQRDLGLGAEEVERVEPLLTFRNKEGEIEGVKYNQLSAVLVNAIKEQQQQIHNLQNQIIRLRSQVERRHRHSAASARAQAAPLAPGR